ncbi:putative alpha/Beta hydrolase [Helianthus annuus]|nr:putative alpha/Beta hydrolase [Helianthus annuus]
MMCRRHDMSKELESLECKSIIFVGDKSPFLDDAFHMKTILGKRCSAFVEVHPCGSMVTEEQPHAMLIPLELFLKGFGFYRPCQFNDSPRSPLDSCCIDPSLLYPKQMGLKLRPIKTRVSPPQPRAKHS